MVRVWLSVNAKRHGVDCEGTVGRIGPWTRADRSRMWPHLGHIRIPGANPFTDLLATELGSGGHTKWAETMPSRRSFHTTMIFRLRIATDRRALLRPIGPRAVCPSAFIRTGKRPAAARLCAGWSPVEDITNHAESGTPSERYRYTVARETPSIFAISKAVMPLSRRLRALAAAASSTLRGRPPLRPLAAAAASPARVRSIMVSRSSWAKAAMIVSMALPIAPSVWQTLGEAAEADAS
jgi:hypothetical protein